MKRGPVFEVRPNIVGAWFWHAIAGGKISETSGEPYASKSNATRAAKRKAATTAGATWRVVGG